MLMFLLRKTSVLFVFFKMRLMCVFHDTSEEMSTPIYFVEETDSSMQLWRVYCVGHCYVNDSSFRAVKFHVTFMTPALQVVKIFLENLRLGRCWDGKIKSSVICKESHVGLDIHRKIIYVDWKEKGSQHRPLRYSRWDRYMFGWRSIYNDRLVAVIKKPFDPFKSRTSYTIVM